MRTLTTFPRCDEFDRARDWLDALSLPYGVISPDPGYALVGAPALVLAPEVRWSLAAGIADLACCGWVDHYPAATTVPGQEPLGFEEDVFGRAAIVLLASCVGDRTKIRFVAHISGDLTRVFPYLNAEMQTACYNARGPTFTFMDGYRMASLCPRRIAVAKADEIVDAWRVLEDVRRRVNRVWERREEIEPCYEMRERPPALEIFKRLPKTNCRACGERTCLAFAVGVHAGELAVTQCEPVFRGDFAGLKDPLLAICSGLGVGT